MDSALNSPHEEHDGEEENEPSQAGGNTTTVVSEKSNRPNGKKWFSKPEGKLRPFRLLRQDIRNLKARYFSDWTLFNQQILASAVYVFFTNLLPGITFASDLDVFTSHTWGTIEVVFSTGLVGLIFAL